MTAGHFDTTASFFVSLPSGSTVRTNRRARPDRVRARSFSQLLLIARGAFGPVAAERLRHLREAEIEPGERRLSFRSVQVALAFLLENHWPLKLFYSTPSGNLQCVWALHGGGRLVARFGDQEKVSFAVLRGGSLCLAGEDTLDAFCSIAPGFRRELTKEAVVGEAEQAFPETETQKFFRQANTESTQYRPLLQPGSAGGWSAYWRPFSTEAP